VASTGPNNVDADQLALTQAAYDAAKTATLVQNQHPVETGTPVHPEIRQVTPPEQMGAGYRPASESDPR
jgi:hypothetical protein